MIFGNGTFRLTATDLSNHLGCHYLTGLNRLEAMGELTKPHWTDPSLEALIKRGEEHEASYLQNLKNEGRSVVYLKNQSLEATTDAMKKGVDVIAQAQLARENWIGFADFLIKIPGNSKFGDWSYEVYDTKLALETRAATILQLCLYTDVLGDLQGFVPERMFVVTPGDGFPKSIYLYTDFQAYYRQVKRNLEYFTFNPAQTYPDPVPQCDICRWWKHCDRKRHEDDHLSLVAGIRSSHIAELNRQKIETLTEFAGEQEALREKPQRGNVKSYESIQHQAKVQVKGRPEGKYFELLQLQVDRGLSRLPEPTEGDVYFDIEGDHFYGDGGLEYLLGFTFINKHKKYEYKAIWAHDRTTEKKAFEDFMDFVMKQWQRYPNMYIYHYGVYEPAALGRLTGRHATKNGDVDKLFRGKRLIDLHQVIRESLKASVERYSLKDLERFTSYLRKIELPLAAISRRSFEAALELKELSSLASETSSIIQDYNEDDCRATEAIHRWMEAERINVSLDTRPPVESGEPSEEVQALETRAQSLYAGLVEGLPVDKSQLNELESGRWLLANLVDYFRRENRTSWWEYFRVHKLDYENLLDERHAIAGLEFVSVVPPKGRERNPTHRYRYPQQEIGIDEGDEMVEILGEAVGKVVAISTKDCTIDIKRTKESADHHPISVHKDDVVNPEPLASSLFDVALGVIDHGIDAPWPYPAAKSLLLKRRPNIGDSGSGPLFEPNEEPLVGAVRIVSSLEKSVLAIQGPPGSGKTYTGAMMILELVKQGRKVGVTAVSHKVIRNLFDEANKLAHEKGFNATFVHKSKEKSESLPAGIVEVTDNKKLLESIMPGNVVGATAWFWARNDVRETVEYLFVDEAGQMSLSFVLAAARATKNLILLGDPQQLEQPQRGAHPEGADVAALSHFLDGKKTMPPDRGLFLETTRRLHPKITEYTSELFYEKKLHSFPGLEKQVISGGTQFDGAGLFFVSVTHSGNHNKSREEVDTIERIVTDLLARGYWSDEHGVTRALEKKNILIVAPYNAQVSALNERLPDFPIGTVDRFQGQGAPIVIYSMTSSSAEDSPRGMNFLFSLNRLNVATSRARCLCILVASPKLLEAECKTVEQMRWTNGLCRFGELATKLPAASTILTIVK